MIQGKDAKCLALSWYTAYSLLKSGPWIRGRVDTRKELRSLRYHSLLIKYPNASFDGGSRLMCPASELK